MLSLQAVSVPGGVVLDLQGEFTVYELNKIKDAMDLLGGKGVLRYVFNMGKIEYIDSSGVGLLVNYSKKWNTMGGAFVVANLSQAAQEVIKMTRSDRLMKIFPTVDSAVESFTAGQTAK